MGIRCLLALFTLFLVLLAPVTSFPTRSTVQSHDHIGVSSFLRMLKDQILNRSRGTGSRGSGNGVKGHEATSNVDSPNMEAMPVWPARPKIEGWSIDGETTQDWLNVANGSDRDLSPGVPFAGIEDEKRGSDYGHGFFFGKRVPNDNEKHHRDETTMHRDRRPDDYNWGMWFGKRGRSDAYGWGGFFGKRGGDVIEYDDFVA